MTAHLLRGQDGPPAPKRSQAPIRTRTALAMALLAPTAARAADPVVQTLEHAEIDWTDGNIVATGSGAPDPNLKNMAKIRLAAEKAAQLDAYRRVIEALKGVQITVTQTGRDRLSAPQIRAKVEGVVRGCTVKDTRYYSEGGVDVVLSCPFGGGLATALAPAGARATPPEGSKASATGLIIDASGVEARPTLIPTLSGPSGPPILGPRTISSEALRSLGSTVFVRSLSAAQALARVGKKPVVVNVSSIDPRRGWLLTQSEVGKLKGMNLGFLSAGRIAVVLSPEERK